MAVKSQSDVRTISTTKKKLTIRKKKTLNSPKNSFSHLSEEIVSNVSVGIYIVENGCFIYVSPVFQNLSGYSFDDLAGTNPLDYVHADDRDIVRNNAIKNLKGISKSYEYRFIGKDGKVIWVLEMITSIIQKGKRLALGSWMDITEHKRIQDKLRQSEEKYRTILDEMDDSYFEVDLAGSFLFVNDANCRNTGFSREEMIGTTFRNQVVEEDLATLLNAYKQIFKTGKPERGICYRFIRKDGTMGFAETAAFPLRNPKGEIIGFRGVGRDITKRRQMEETIRQSEERYRTIINEMEEWYFETDLTGNITFCNDIFANVLGHSPRELTHANFHNFVNKEDSDSIYRLFKEVHKTGNPIKNSPYEFVRPDGGRTFAEFSIFPKWDHEANLVGFRGVGHDITERKCAEERIQYLATHDALTGLPNRLMFSQLLNHAIQAARRYQRQFAVLFIDLDRFKIINDTLGHEAGDKLLQEIALRLKQTLRAVDVAARLGGDEFVILIEELSDLNQVEAAAGRILSAVIKPVNLMNEECRVTASIGISVFPKDAQDEQSLMKNADLAMYLAKEEGKNNYQFYSTDVQSKSLELLSIETNLRFALERNELTLQYQAKVDFKTDTINGVEALLRWNNPNLGPVTPTQFIPVAEESGLIVPIGRWVLRTACAQNAAWQRNGLPPVRVAVNLSLRQLMDEFLIEDVKKALKDSGMAPDLLELEITESMIMHNPTRMITVLQEIKKLGVHLAIDDFGTGYSSLAQIKNFPVDTLKVDRSFIRNITKDNDDKAITEAIISMGKTLNLTVIAEGVETEEQMKFLKDHSCDEMQGYYFSKPVMPEQFAELLRKHEPSPQVRKDR